MPELIGMNGYSTWQCPVGHMKGLAPLDADALVFCERTSADTLGWRMCGRQMTRTVQVTFSGYPKETRP